MKIKRKLTFGTNRNHLTGAPTLTHFSDTPQPNNIIKLDT